MENSNKKVTVSFETTEADYLSSLSPYKDISLSGPVDIFATADILGSSDSKPTYEEYKKYSNKETWNYESLADFLSNYNGQVAVYSWGFDNFIRLAQEKESKSIIIYVDDVREIYTHNDHRGAYFRLLDVIPKEDDPNFNNIHCIWQEVLLGTHSHDNISTLDKLSDKDGVLRIRKDDGSTEAVGCGNAKNILNGLSELLPDKFKEDKAKWDDEDNNGYIVDSTGHKISEPNTPAGRKPYHLDARLSDLVNTYDWKDTLDNSAAGSCRDLYLELLNIQRRVFLKEENEQWKISLDSGTYEISLSATNVSFDDAHEATQAVYSPELKAYILKFPFTGINLDTDNFFVFSDNNLIKEVNNGRVAYRILSTNEEKLGTLTIALKEEAINQLENKKYSEITVLCVHNSKADSLFKQLFEDQLDAGGDLSLENIRIQLLQCYAENKIIAKPKFPQLFLSTDESGNIQWTNTFTPAQRFYSAQKILTESEKANLTGKITINFPAAYFDPTEDFPLVRNDQAYEYTAKVEAKGDNSVNVTIDKESFSSEGNSVITLIIIKSGAGKSLADELADKYISKADAIKILSKGSLNITDFFTKDQADARYAKKNHTHAEYSLKTHNHDERYANFYHTHPEIIRQILLYINNNRTDVELKDEIAKLDKEFSDNCVKAYNEVLKKINDLNEFNIKITDSSIIDNINNLINEYNELTKAYNESVEDDKDKLPELTKLPKDSTLQNVLIRLTELIDRSSVTTDEVLLKKSIRVHLKNGPIGGLTKDKVYEAGKSTLDDILRDILDPYYDTTKVRDILTPASFTVSWYEKIEGKFEELKTPLENYKPEILNESKRLYFKPIIKNKDGKPCEFRYYDKYNRENVLSLTTEYYVNGVLARPEELDGKSTGIYKYSEEEVFINNSTEMMPIVLKYYNLDLVDSQGISNGTTLLDNEDNKDFGKLSFTQKIVVNEPDFYYGLTTNDANIIRPDRTSIDPAIDKDVDIYPGYFNENKQAEIHLVASSAKPVIFIALEDKFDNCILFDNETHNNVLPYFNKGNENSTGFDNYSIYRYNVYLDNDEKEEFDYTVKEG